MGKTVIGVDFGTLSARALVLDAVTGEELGTASMDYPHGVMDRTLPCGRPLAQDWALQHPEDWTDCLRTIVPEALRAAGVSCEDVAGFGLDITSSTALPVDAEEVPLCLKEEFADNPYAWPMLWKHHAAQDKAHRIEQMAAVRGETFLRAYGGKVSSEWLLPKVWQVLDEAPEVYEAAAAFVEAGDWLVGVLTGAKVRAENMAGYKAFWQKDCGFPSEEFLAALDPRLAHFYTEKTRGEWLGVGCCAGRLSAQGARVTGLCEGTPVAVPGIDAHIAVPGVGAVETGSMLMIIGTSTCDMILGGTKENIEGICGVVRDGIMPGSFGYEAGQSCCGDHFDWFVKNAVPKAYTDEAARRRMDIHALLTEKASALRPGQSGLLALDWWNGNRSVLMDFDLTGMLLGMTLATRPEEVYRALIEATAYGARRIMDNFEAQGLPVKTVYACGGIAKKNALFMQIYADVLRREIRVSACTQIPARGSAIAAASAAGLYADIGEASRRLCAAIDTVYTPVVENAAVYEALYTEYTALHDYFGRGGNDVMKHLKALRKSR